jgi:hypothetical protein
MFADSAELMDQRKASEYRVIPDAHMACQTRTICKYSPVAQDTVMGYVDVGHQKIIVPNPGNPNPRGGASIKGCVFPYDISVADRQLRIFISVARVLGRLAKGGELINSVARSNFSSALDYDMGPYIIIVAKHNTVLDNGERSDRYVVTEGSTGVHQRSLMNHLNSLWVNRTSEEQAISLFTQISPRQRHKPFFLATNLATIFI